MTDSINPDELRCLPCAARIICDRECPCEDYVSREWAGEFEPNERVVEMVREMSEI